jgi:hypothetical protein
MKSTAPARASGWAAAHGTNEQLHQAGRVMQERPAAAQHLLHRPDHVVHGEPLRAADLQHRRFHVLAAHEVRDRARDVLHVGRIDRRPAIPITGTKGRWRQNQMNRFML